VDRWRALADADDNYGEAWIMTHVSSSEATGSTWPKRMFWSVLQKPQPRCSTLRRYRERSALTCRDPRVRTCRRGCSAGSLSTASNVFTCAGNTSSSEVADPV
jgi:hypothetical protein